MTNDNTERQAKLYRQKNALKDKLHLSIQDKDKDGQIAPDQIAEADAVIAQMCKNCRAETGDLVLDLLHVWAEMQDSKALSEDMHISLSERVFTLAHEIKDINALCGYPLIAHFAESLRDYISEIQVDMESKRVIIQAHIDAINTAHKNDIHDEGGAIAEELKKMVKIAVDKYH